MSLTPEHDRGSARLQEVVRFFCRHLVSLSVWYQWVGTDNIPFGDLHFASYSGFVISIRGVWNFVTAGHILEDLERNIENKSIKIKNCVLVDKFGPDAVSQFSIPFEYNNAPKFFVNEKDAGLDFGLIILTAHYCDLLKANGVVPILEKDWKNIPDELQEKHVMLGLPRCLIKTKTAGKNEDMKLVSSVSPAAIGVERIYDKTLEKDYPQFVGRLHQAGYTIENIDGMSGGPIIGFSKDWTRYWVVAIQSSWLPESRITFGCLVSVFTQIVEDFVSRSEEKPIQE